MNEESRETIDRLLELGAKAPEQITITGSPPVVMLPGDCKLESLERFYPPQRIKQNPLFLEAGSFVDYVNRFKAGATLIFARVTESGAGFIALLDYHTAAPELLPAYCAHTARFDTLETPEWKIWMAANRKQMDQVTFATWLEDNAGLFTDPTGADLLELVQTLEGKSEVRFNSGVRLQSGGNKLHYDEDVTLRGASTTKEGEVDLPAVLTAGIAPFQGGPQNEVKARLKYRIEGRKLSLWYETIAMHVIIRDSIMLLVKLVAEKTGITPLLGNP